jgi:hypothetical protein
VQAVLRDDLLAHLRDAPSGLSTAAVLGKINIEVHGADAAVVEALLMLSPEVTQAQASWRLEKKGRVGMILDAIDLYAVSTGKRIFRAGAALESVPLHERPSHEELKQIIEQSSGRYELLPNQMIRRN